MISAGEVPGLYTPEELEPLLSQLSDEMRNQYECRTLFEFFVKRVKNKLSVVVSLDNKHPMFASYCACNPSLFNKCSIFWLENFTKESYHSLAKSELKSTFEEKGKILDEMVQGAIFLHRESESRFIVSPLTFANMLHTLVNIYQETVAKSGGQTKHLN